MRFSPVLVAFFSLLLAGSALAQPSPELDINPADQTCKTHTDCVVIPGKCDQCECGLVVNSAHEERYRQAFEELCAEFSGAQCKFHCATPHPACEKGKCVLSAEEPK